MPRKRIRKNCYVQASRLNNHHFSRVLLCCLVGVPAKTAIELLAMEEEPVTISEKSVNKYYKIIGEKLFSLLLEPVLLRVEPIFVSLREADPASYERCVEAILRQFHEDAINCRIDGYQYQVGAIYGKQWAFTGPAIEYRELSRLRKGIGGNIKAALGVAYLRNAYMELIDRNPQKYDYEEMTRITFAILHDEISCKCKKGKPLYRIEGALIKLVA